MAKLVLPRVQAMVLCDAVKESEEESDVYHLHGVRSVIEAPSFPYTHPRLCVYLQLSGHAGEASCHIEINHPETDAVIYQSTRLVIPFKGPRFVVPAVFRLRNCGFPAPGVYFIQVIHEDKLIGERPLHLWGED